MTRGCIPKQYNPHYGSLIIHYDDNMLWEQLTRQIGSKNIDFRGTYPSLSVIIDNFV